MPNWLKVSQSSKLKPLIESFISIRKIFTAPFVKEEMRP